MTDPDRALARWRETWALLPHPAPEAPLRRLAALYAEPHRAYHHLGHVLDCLELARGVRDRLESPVAVELALWYHDAIYDSRASDNEERSAAFAVAELDALDVATRARAVARPFAVSTT